MRLSLQFMSVIRSTMPDLRAHFFPSGASSRGARVVRTHIHTYIYAHNFVLSRLLYVKRPVNPRREQIGIRAKIGLDATK